MEGYGVIKYTNSEFMDKEKHEKSVAITGSTFWIQTENLHSTNLVLNIVGFGSFKSQMRSLCCNFLRTISQKVSKVVLYVYLEHKKKFGRLTILIVMQTMTSAAGLK
jgi:hypothetical protein